MENNQNQQNISFCSGVSNIDHSYMYKMLNPVMLFCLCHPERSSSIYLPCVKKISEMWLNQFSGFEPGQHLVSRLVQVKHGETTERCKCEILQWTN